MNRIFKTVWSRTKNMYVVVSEIVNSCGKSKGEHVINIKAAFVAVLILTSSALGNGVQAKGHEALESGGGAKALGLKSVALGYYAQAEKQFSTAVGWSADAKGDDSTAYGYKAIADGLSSTALGNGAEGHGRWSTAVGSLAIAGKESSTALGQGANALGISSTAVGYGAKALVDGSIVLGSGSIASIDKGVFGYDPLAGKASTETSAIWKATQAALSVGSTGDATNLITRQITGVAAGSEETDAVNVAQLKALNTKVDKGAVHYFSVKSMDLSTDKGEGSNWKNDGATGVYAVAIGVGAQAQGNSSTALGHKANAVGNFSTALGYIAQAQGNYSMALGYQAKALLDGSVALGRDSIASIDKGIIGYDPLTGKASTETSAIWKATQAALSIGSTEDKNNLITRQITGVAAGTEDTDAVNVAQLKALEKKLTKGCSNVEVVGDQDTGIVVDKNPKENKPNPSTGGTTPSTGGTTPSTGGTTPSTGGTTPAPAAESKTVYKVKLDKKVDVGNISIDGNENKETITIGKGDNNVIVNNTGLTIAKGPSVTNNGINAGNKKITNVADATEDGDAVNYKQLKQATQGMADISGEINHVGAHSAALAALHPLDFDPDEKLDIAAGVGNYNGSNAVAIGAYYRPNESTMISVGGSFGSGKNMVNAGVSVKVGQGNNVSRSRIAMAKEIKDMRAELETLRKAVAGISQGEKVDPIKMKLFPDVPENHWAYEYVKELVKQGVIDGYPDGTFKGDRMMTRYEFAAIFYKAMQKGINVNKKILDEFEVELERFRIDVIAKDKDGNPTIERIRVN